MKRLWLLALLACRTPDPPAVGDTTWTDTFDRNEIGGDYLATADVYQIRDGALRVVKAYNQPLWLRKKLPADAIIEVDARSLSPVGDIKVEAWGDGESKARDRGAYTATGYVFVQGGWSNSLSILARQDEHGQAKAQRNQPKVEVGRTYHWKIVKRGGHIEWFVDGQPFLTYDDANPLSGKGHEYFGFNDWEAELVFDNLSITPLK